MTDPEPSLEDLRPLDIAPLESERLLRRAQASLQLHAARARRPVLGRVGRLYGRYLEPAAVGAGIAVYLLWAVAAIAGR